MSYLKLFKFLSVGSLLPTLFSLLKNNYRNTSISAHMAQDYPGTGASKISTKTRKTDKYASVASQNAPSDKYDEDFDDFDPRGTSSASGRAISCW